MNEKKCKKCDLPKPLPRFIPNRAQQVQDGGGKEAFCACNKAKAKVYYRKTRLARIVKGHEWYEQNQELFAQYIKDYRADNLARYRVHWKKGRQRRKELKKRQFVAPVVFKDIYIRDRGICYLCGQIVPRNQLSLDHIIPLSKGGTHEPDNVALAHFSCNSSKGSMSYSDFLHKKKGPKNTRPTFSGTRTRYGDFE